MIIKIAGAGVILCFVVMACLLGFLIINAWIDIGWLVVPGFIAGIIFVAIMVALDEIIREKLRRRRENR
jgi:hypothetical protein